MWIIFASISKCYLNQLNPMIKQIEIIFWGTFLFKKLNIKNFKIKTMIIKSLKEEKIPSRTKWGLGHIKCFMIYHIENVITYFKLKGNKSIALYYIVALLLFEYHNYINSSILDINYNIVTKYFIGHVTMFFANNYLTEYRITMEFLHNFLDPDVILVHIPCLLMLPQRSLLL